MKPEEIKAGDILLYTEQGAQAIVRVKQIMRIDPQKGYPDGYLKFILVPTKLLPSLFMATSAFTVGVTLGKGQHYCPWRMEKLF